MEGTAMTDTHFSLAQLILRTHLHHLLGTVDVLPAAGRVEPGRDIHIRPGTAVAFGMGALRPDSDPDQFLAWQENVLPLVELAQEHHDLVVHPRSLTGHLHPAVARLGSPGTNLLRWADKLGRDFGQPWRVIDADTGWRLRTDTEDHYIGGVRFLLQPDRDDLTGWTDPVRDRVVRALADATDFAVLPVGDQVLAVPRPPKKIVQGRVTAVYARPGGDEYTAWTDGLRGPDQLATVHLGAPRFLALGDVDVTADPAPGMVLLGHVWQLEDGFMAHSIWTGMLRPYRRRLYSTEEAAQAAVKEVHRNLFTPQPDAVWEAMDAMVAEGSAPTRTAPVLRSLGLAKLGEDDDSTMYPTFAALRLADTRPTP